MAEQWSWENHPQKVMPVETPGFGYPSSAPYLIWYDDETITIPLTNNAPIFTIRDVRGAVVRTGTNTTASFSTAALPAGHYRIYFTKTGDSAVDVGYGEPFNGCLGAVNVSVWRRNGVNAGMPARPTTMDNSTGDFTTYHDLMYALNGFMHRYTIDRAEDPHGTQPTLDGALADLNFQRTRYLAINDPGRPHYAVVSLRNGADAAGAVAGMADIVSTLGTNKVLYEGINEPDGSNSGTTYFAKAQNFYNAVKAANPAAQVLGPAQVNINYRQGFTEEFFAAGGNNYLDAISFHAYNTFDGDLRVARQNIEYFISVLQKYNLHTKPRFMTEWGFFASVYGSFQPLRQMFWTMMNVLFMEQYGVPKENFFYFYNKASGFWDYPSFMVSDRAGLFPLGTAIRVFSEEVFGKTFTQRLNFGDEDYDYLGSLYSASDGSGMIAVMSIGRQGDQLSFIVTGATSLHVVDAVGGEQTATVSGGILTLTIPEYPLYIQLPVGVTCVPKPRKLGRNLATDASWSRTVSSSGHAYAYKLTDPIYDRGQSYNIDDQMPVTLTTTLPFDQSFDTIYVRGNYPWQIRSGILDAHVDVFVSGGWTTIGTIHNDYIWLNFRSSADDTNCWCETYYDMRCSWILTLPQEVRASKLRVVVTKATWGGEVAEVATTPAYGQGLNREAISLQAIEVYNVKHANKKQMVIQGI